VEATAWTQTDSRKFLKWSHVSGEISLWASPEFLQASTGSLWINKLPPVAPPKLARNGITIEVPPDAELRFENSLKEFVTPVVIQKGNQATVSLELKQGDTPPHTKYTALPGAIDRCYMTVQLGIEVRAKTNEIILRTGGKHLYLEVPCRAD
jgi:hypothetical protein